MEALIIVLAITIPILVYFLWKLIQCNRELQRLEKEMGPSSRFTRTDVLLNQLQKKKWK